MSEFKEEAEHLLARVVDAVQEYRLHNGGLTLKELYEMGERQTMVAAIADYLTVFSKEAHERGRRETLKECAAIRIPSRHVGCYEWIRAHKRGVAAYRKAIRVRMEEK